MTFAYPAFARFAETRRIAVLQGEALASGDPAVEYGAVLGSCVAACLYDPVARIGGMNHFLLARPREGRASSVSDRDYGLYLMEMLIAQMLRRGASKERLRAHLYGGATIRAGLGSIGANNAEFACQFLQRERIPLLHADLGDVCARSVHFRPASGRVRVRQVDDPDSAEPSPPALLP